MEGSVKVEVERSRSIFTPFEGSGLAVDNKKISPGDRAVFTAVTYQKIK
jgi:hypothetical protein